MPRNLTTQEHDQIFTILRNSFSDFPLFDSLVAPKLRLALEESNDIVEINEKTTKKVVERYYAMDAFVTTEQKALVYPLELIFQSCYVLIVSHRDAAKACQWTSMDFFLQNYPQFAQGVSPDEQQYLMNFRNVLKIALMIIPARLNKGRLLQIAGKLEGSNNEYITGSGQKIEVDRRVEIYQQEGKIKATVKKSTKRMRLMAEALALSNNQYNVIPVSQGGGAYPSDSETNVLPERKKRRKGLGPLVCTSSSFSNSKLKMMNMAPDAVKDLLLPPHMDCIPPLALRKLNPMEHRPAHRQGNHYKDIEDVMGPAVCSSLEALMELPYPYRSSATAENARFGTVSPPLSQESLSQQQVASQVPSSVSCVPSSYPSPPSPTERETTVDMILNCGLLSDAWDLSDLQGGGYDISSFCCGGVGNESDGIGSNESYCPGQSIFPPATGCSVAVEDDCSFYQSQDNQQYQDKVLAKLMTVGGARSLGSQQPSSVPSSVPRSCSAELNSEFSMLLSEDFSGLF